MINNWLIFEFYIAHDQKFNLKFWNLSNTKLLIVIMDQYKELICIVRKYPELWDPKDKYYNQRVKVSRTWNNISNKIGLPSNLII